MSWLAWLLVRWRKRDRRGEGILGWGDGGERGSIDIEGYR